MDVLNLIHFNLKYKVYILKQNKKSIKKELQMCISKFMQITNTFAISLQVSPMFFLLSSFEQTMVKTKQKFLKRYYKTIA